MDLRKFLWLLIVINTLGIRIPRSSIPPSLADQLVNILKSCFADRLNPVIITDDLIEIVYKETIDFPVQVIGKDFKAKPVTSFNPRYPTYVLSVNSVHKLEETLRELATLSTWSIESVFLLVGHNNCDQNGRQVLELLWNMNQLTAFFICSKSIYTVNPFSNRVPLPWQQVSDQSQDENKVNRPALFKRPYNNDPKLCLSLKFEKTKHLDGFPVKATVDSSYQKINTQNKTLQVENLRKILQYVYYKYFETIFSTLNVTSEIDYIEVDNNSRNNVSDVILNQLGNGSIDICLNLQYITILGYEKVDILKPEILNDLFILIHPRGAQKPIPTKFSVNLTFVLASVFALLVSYLVIIINKINNLNLNDDDDPEYGNSFLDILRFIISTGILTPLNSRSMQIMFITTTLIVYIISPELQGKITSSSTKQEYIYPASIKDLFDLNYTVYVFESTKKTLIERKNEFNTNVNRLQSFVNSKDECYQRILNDPTIACVYFNKFQLEMALKHNFPLISVSEIDKYHFFWSKKNWPLKKKIDSITRRLYESGILPYWKRKTIDLPLKKLRAKEASKPLSEYVPTEFDDLKLLYILLGSLTLVLSIFVFLAELLVAKIIIRRRQRVDDNRRRRLRARARRFREQNVNDRFLQDKVRIVRGRVVILP